MTDRLALILFCLVLGFLALDHWVLGWGTPLFLGRKLDSLIEWLAFWR